MERRTYLRGIPTLGVVGTAGCLGADSTPNVVLSEPDRQFSSADVPYPAWGEKLPDATLPAPIENRTVALRAAEKPRLLTFIYTYCQTVCPVLTSTMRNIQTHALNNGYGDQVQFYEITFDPERDTAERLRQYAEQRNIDMAAGNWDFLRPESNGRAKQVVQDQFGVAFQRTHPEDMDRYMFTHTPMMTLVNGDDYVERAYRTKSPDVEQIITDLNAVRNA